MKRALTALDQHLMGFNHVPRTDGECPLAMISKRQLETVSYPMNDMVKTLMLEINAAVSYQSNIIGHIEIAEDEVEITSGFAGAKGNLILVNTGRSAIKLKLTYLLCCVLLFIFLNNKTVTVTLPEVSLRCFNLQILRSTEFKTVSFLCVFCCFCSIK